MLIAFLVISFVVPFTRNTGFIVAIVFGIIAILVGAFGIRLAFKDGASVKSKFYGFPIARVSVIYAIVQIIVSFIFMGISWIVPMWVEVIVCFILLIAAIIGLVATDITRDVIEQQDIKQKVNTETMLALRSKANALVGICGDEEIKKGIQDLADEFRYSDPVSNDEVKGLEAELEVILGELQEALVDGNTEDAKKLRRKCQVQLAERNRICKLSK